MSRRPTIKYEIPICIICEGSEEYDYLSRLKELNLWDEIYRVDLVDAKGNGNLPARYQDKYQNGMYELVLVFCDTDKPPYTRYTEIKDKINRFHGSDEASSKVVVFGNPCTMQIIIEHWGDYKLKSPAKGSNANLIAECTGIWDYSAKTEQRRALMSKINKENYLLMLQRIGKLSSDDNEPNSTNFDYVMNCLSSPDAAWVDDINSIL
ncbi:MAG: hypothetical protein IJ757_07990 [Clostridiales bacterium]|nr:hypothetical protein [Clostridiales bacterium]